MKRGKTRLIEVCVLGIGNLHVFCLDDPITGVIVAVTKQDGIPSNWVKLAVPLLQGFDNPHLETKRAKETNVGDLLEPLLEWTEFALAESWETVGGKGCSANRLSPPLLG
jgi:hypothetical protein